MSDDRGLIGGTEPGNGADNAAQIALVTQYVKDLSFENPNAPAVYQWQGQPQIDVQFNINVDAVGDDAHEVVLLVRVKAAAADKTAFQVEIAYAGLFAVRNVAEDDLRPFMLAEAPRLLFPFARRVIADTVRDGGFPQLMLDPIDFAALYMQQVEAQQAQAMTPQGTA
jgi:preprotein translocase subunit SecB